MAIAFLIIICFALLCCALLCDVLSASRVGVEGPPDCRPLMLLRLLIPIRATVLK